MRTHVTPLLLAALLALGLAGTAHAGVGQFSIIQDDDQLLHRGDAARDEALSRMQALGVDVVRVTVLWKDLAPQRRSAGFHGENPSSYLRRRWVPFDRLVLSAQTHGIGVYLQPTGPGPAWATGTTKDKKSARSYRPNPREFYKFVAAVGRRYSGTYTVGGTTLPRVSFWSIYNEPNQGAWLTPQYAFDRTAGKVIPESPVLYRELFLEGRKALQDTGHGNDFVMLGETAPLGSGKQTIRSPIRPKKFIRELFCVAGNGRPYTGRAAKARRCGLFKKFGPFKASGFAHHPYTKDLPPTRRDPNRDSLTMANITELSALLDQMAAKTHEIQPNLPVLLTEFGYETNPPDPFRRFTPEQQAEFINLGDLLSWLNPRILANTQFLLKDAAPLRQFRRGSKQYWFTYQSGLFFANGTPKPAAAAYALPLVVNPASDGTTESVWGQLRFLPNGVPGAVRLQYRPNGGGDFQNVGDPVQVNDPLGFFTAQLPSQGPGIWRAEWTSPDGSQTVDSRSVVVSG